MMHSLDENVGRVLRHLDKSGERENTVVAFLSDNGGTLDNASWNGPLSGTKGTLREGGVRVPFFLSWPGTLPAKAKYDGVVSGLDLLPTFLAAAGAEPLALRKPLSHEDKRNFQQGVRRFGPYDGINLLPALKGEAKAPDRLLFWRLQGQTAVIKGEHKLVTLTHRPAQLFRPATDPGETSDLASEEVKTLTELFGEIGRWQSMLPTVPLWDSSPYWWGESARLYDTHPPREEPR